MKSRVSNGRLHCIKHVNMTASGAIWCSYDYNKLHPLKTVRGHKWIALEVEVEQPTGHNRIIVMLRWAKKIDDKKRTNGSVAGFEKS